jgi:DNA-binding transcriptional MerR regulator
MNNLTKSPVGGNNLITAGELAKLAGTTKRTILWYDELGIIKPVEVSSEGYRYYSESQVLDYQMILLLTTLGVTLKEIKTKNDLKSLFKEKRLSIKDQIDNLQFNLSSLERFMSNLGTNQTLIKPEIKTLKPFDVYYVEKISSYVSIGKYCQELSEMFTNRGNDFTTLAIFDNPTYQPKKSLIKICAVAQPGMLINPKFKNEVKHLLFAPGKVITYTHNGAGEMLSLFWKELEKYCRLNKIEVRHDAPDFEIYRKVNPDSKKQFFEIYLPIK